MAKVAFALFLLGFSFVGDGTRPEQFGGGITFAAQKHESAGYFDESGEEFYFTRTNADFSSPQAFVTQLRNGRWISPMVVRNGEAGKRLPNGDVLLLVDPQPGTKNDFGDIALIRQLEPKPQAATRLPLPINTDKSECCAAPAGSDGSFYFSSERDGGWDIFFARKTAKGYAVDKLPAQVNSEFGEWPSYADPHGRFLLFSSIRKTGRGGDDIYIAYFRDGKWMTAALLPEPVNTSAYEDGAMLSPDHNLFIWSSRCKTPDGDTSSNIYSIPAHAVGLRLD